jgi:hypothetical protein
MENTNLNPPMEFMATSNDFISKVEEWKNTTLENVKLEDISNILTSMSNSVNGLIEYLKEQPKRH